MTQSNFQPPTWSVADAKARLSEVIELTRNGKPSVVVVSIDEWARKTERKGSLGEFLLASPLRGADLERAGDASRDLDL